MHEKCILVLEIIKLTLEKSSVLKKTFTCGLCIFLFKANDALLKNKKNAKGLFILIQLIFFPTKLCNVIHFHGQKVSLPFYI